MTFDGWIQIALFCVVITLLVKPLGGYMTRVFAGERTFLSPVLRPVERGIYRLSGVDERAGAALARPMPSRMLLFSLAGLPLPLRAAAPAGAAAVQPAGPVGGRGEPRLQHGRQLHHQHQLAVLRAGETTMSYLVQMAGLTVHNFVSAATGIALAIALVRGFARRSAHEHRQLLGRSDALHALRAAADLDRRRRCSSSGRACRRTSTPTPRPRRWKAPSR